MLVTTSVQLLYSYIGMHAHPTGLYCWPKKLPLCMQVHVYLFADLSAMLVLISSIPLAFTETAMSRPMARGVLHDSGLYALKVKSLCRCHTMTYACCAFNCLAETVLGSCTIVLEACITYQQDCCNGSRMRTHKYISRLGRFCAYRKWQARTRIHVLHTHR